MKAVIDIETGGFSVKSSGIVEIAMVVIDDENNVVTEYRSLIKPYHKEDSIELMEYSESAEKVHGYTMDQLRNEGKYVKVVVREINALIFKHDIVELIGHNIDSFDYPRIAHLWERFSAFPDGLMNITGTKDTMIESKRLLNANSYSLENLCRSLEIEHNSAHTALGDCRATLNLYKYLLE